MIIIFLIALFNCISFGVIVGGYVSVVVFLKTFYSFVSCFWIKNK